MTGHPKSIKNARDVLLRHPLSQLSDMRLVSACDIMVLEYQLLETLPTTEPDDPRCQAHLQEARTRMDQWFSIWDALVGKHYSIEHYMRQTLRIHKEYGFLTLHMAGMPRIITSADLDSVSDAERSNCIHVLSAAKEIARISVEEPSYRDGLRYSPTCFYSGVSFVGATLLRLGAALKGEEQTINRYTVELYRVLSDVPTCRFKFQFVSLLKEKGLIPEDSPGDEGKTLEN
ncbi:hypothetical protein Clacol_000692 [Clathrus columnatus]|uniref:Uncharacterized protein n=1 Tax=Clathrus columnatus TaxID=1419009 RepID=A0AAV5A0F8_9AGAM|nr:hypothetical protein Clacol_000692 [Clathrus columnatus]